MKCSESEKDALSEKRYGLLNSISCEFIEAIIGDRCREAMPIEMRVLTKILKDKGESLQWALAPILGNLIMLRIFNTAIVFPEKNPHFGISKIAPGGRRNLILISKMLQNLANGVEFGTKEEYMLPMNPTIIKYLQRTADFFSSVACSEDELKEYLAKKDDEIVNAWKNHTVYTSVFEDLRRMHDLIVKHQDKFETYFEQSESKNDFLALLTKLPKIDKQELDEKKNELLKGEDETKSPKTLEPLTTYEKTLQKAKSTDLSSIEAARIVTLSGKDKDGLPIILFFEGHMRDQDSNLVFLYFLKFMDSIVKSPYCLVWFVDNSNNATRPGFSWMLNAYRTITYEYKKNLKGFYLIHPTFIYKAIFQFFKPFVSKKFWFKLHSLSELSEIHQWIEKEEIPLPPQILIYDHGLSKKNNPKIFGVPLKDILERKSEQGRRVPRIYQHLMDFIEFHGSNVQGVFRLGGKSESVAHLKLLIDNDCNIDFSFSDINSIASIFKQLFRELDPPLLTYENYNKFIDTMDIEDSGRDSGETVKLLQQIIINLPASSYDTTKHLFAFLNKISQKSDINKMTADNLGIVFGVNLLRGKDLELQDTLKHNNSVNKCVSLMISRYPDIFTQNKRRHRSALVRKHVSVEEFPQ